ncbi:hypothetical protein EJ04DRAFT_514298 [Polyplosphaeria fusca]|uniref:Uncharacterized protein n=1 Tax=Polyplosphaeria fusca TaxID=682080 RepID=A0A9P4QV04_9PLEO|nr:hypothetical protein EJ04DRAFT_514298 [Polyplosphaeria fusca]
MGENDLVCILFGCSVPVILRQRLGGPGNSHFELLGEAYIHGKMDGEALATFDADALASKTQDFDIY